MSESPKLQQLLEELKLLSPADQANLIQGLRGGVATAPTAGLGLVNHSPSACRVTVGTAPPRPLAAGDTLNLPAEPLPQARGSESPASLDRSGLPTAPRALLSVHIEAEGKQAASLAVDMAGWTAQSARYGWPFVFHRNQDSAWQLISGPGTSILVNAGQVAELVAVGVGVDLSDLAERFMLAFEPASHRATANVEGAP